MIVQKRHVPVCQARCATIKPFSPNSFPQISHIASFGCKPDNKCQQVTTGMLKCIGEKLVGK